MTLSMLPAEPRPSARSAVLRWLLVSLVLAGVIAMHVLSQHDAAGGHHGSMLGDSASMMAVPDSHDGHGAGEMVAVVPGAGAAMVMPAAPSGGDLSMAACILFLVVGAGTVLLALLAALRRRFEPFAARSSASRATSIPRGPPHIGPPRISLCVLRV
ncbi:MAG: hypothetical protein WKF57_17435 [Nakamurella sp.]